MAWIGKTVLISALAWSVQARADQGCRAEIVAADLCAAVAGQILETDPSKRTRYAYQSKIYAASCVNPDRDSPDQVKQKIQAFWLRSQPRLVCSQLNFTVREGSVLKLAVERNSRDFINDAVRKWQVDLNAVDASDGRTVLDYIEDELENPVTLAYGLEPILNRYFDLFRSHGAKFSKELAHTPSQQP